MRWSQRNRMKYSPGPSRSPIRYPNCLYGDIRCRQRRGRIKTIPENINQMEMSRNAHLERTRAVQSPANDSRHFIKVVGPRPRCDRMKIEPVNVKIKRINEKPMREDGKAHLEHICTAQPPVNISKRLHRVYIPRCQCGVSNPYLETLIKRKQAERLTFNTLT